MDERILRMAEYSLANDIYPPVVHVEYSGDDDMFPEPVRIAKRVGEYILAQTVRIDEDSHFAGLLKFDGSVPGNIFQRNGHKYYSLCCSKYYLKPLDNLVTAEWEHTNADFGEVIRIGIDGMIARINASRDAHASDPEKLNFLLAMEMVLNTVVRWADKCAGECLSLAENASPERASELREMARILRYVPKHPARTFREAVQTLYLCFHFLPDSIGAPDRYLRPFYERDIAEGRITKEDAENMIGELLCMVSAWTPYSSKHSDKGGESHFAIGGYLPDHTDGFCELSRLILDTMMKLPLVRPQVTIRWTPDMSEETLYYVLDCERHDKGKRLAFCNDVSRIKAYMELAGLSFEEACRYIVVGCNEPAFEGSIDLSGAITNVARSLTDLFTRRRSEILAAANFDEFYAIYEEELNASLTQIIEYMNMFNSIRARDINVVSSPFISGCIERGLSATSGGCDKATFSASLCGYVTVVDSLTVIRQFVYQDRIFTLDKLLSMLDADWEGYEAERQLILRRGHFFGNDYDDSNEIVTRFNESLRRFALSHRSLFGTRILFGSMTGYWQHHTWFGERTTATPDGRHTGDSFVLGISQCGGKDTEGMTSLLNSAAAAFRDGVMNGSVVCNLMLDEVLVRNDDYFAKTVQAIRTYFQNGGLMLQLNYVSRDELLDAQKHPENYRSLRVRVSGFSANFVTLNDALQNDVIARTAKSF